MLSNQDVSRGKPDPEIYAKSISILGLQPHECLVVEDHFNGIKAATAAGAHVMIVNDVNEVNIDNILHRIRAIDSVAA
jgi:beta-phosphoglucomutase-like phosphatase (HAD superfamily)